MNEGLRRPTRHQLIDFIAGAVSADSGTPVNKVVNIEESPNSLRHSCVQTGVTFLPQRYYDATNCGQSVVKYYFCPCCGRMYVCRDNY